MSRNEKILLIALICFLVLCFCISVCGISTIVFYQNYQKNNESQAIMPTSTLGPTLKPTRTPRPTARPTIKPRSAYPPQGPEDLDLTWTILYAQELDLDIQKFTDDVNSQEVWLTVMADIDYGNQLNLAGTPAYVINGDYVGGSTLDYLQNEINFEINNGAPTPVVIEIFMDFQCPACKASYPMIALLEEEFGSAIEIQIHHFPLMLMHKYALPAALGAEAAAKQGKFFEYIELLLDNQQDLSRPNF